MLIKRLFDLSVSVISLILLSPVFLVISIIIKLSDGGPVLYKAPRVGRKGKIFRMYKFRTMVVNADKIGGSSTSNDDPRITGIGKRLRKYKLDEIPQLINVLTGEMSIVGPRPEVKYYTDMFTEGEKIILNVKPGITDYASVWNPDEGKILEGSTDPEKTYFEEIRPEKIRLQLKYVNEQSFWVDLKIILLTIKALFRSSD
jgi:lipopolysaccharide/colanic/teichoic acid biosynthesis glycosyltransferase